MPAARQTEPTKRKRPPVPTRAALRRRRRLARWPVPTVRSQQWSIRYAITAYVLTQVGVLVVAVVIRHVLGLHVPAASGALLVDATLLAGLVPLRRAGRLSAGDLGFRLVPAARSVGLVALALIAVAGLDDLFAAWLQPRTTNPFAGLAQQGTLAIVAAGLAATLTAPVVEEVFFRGLIYRCLRNRLAVLPAATIAAILFAGVHAPTYSPGALPGIACFGLFACLLYERTGSLLPGIALHSLIDATGFEAKLTGHAVIAPIAFLTLAAGLLVRAVYTTRRRRARTAAAG